MDAVIWFRRDLRLHDNPALAAARHHAGQHGGRLRALFIETPQQWREHDMAPRQADLLCRRLNALGSELAQLGVQLELLSVPDFTGVPAVLGFGVNVGVDVAVLGVVDGPGDVLAGAG